MIDNTFFKENQKTISSILVIIVACVLCYGIYAYSKMSNKQRPLTSEEKLEILEQLSKQSGQATASSSEQKAAILKQLSKSQPKQTASSSQAAYDKKMNLLKSLQQPQSK